MEASDANPFQAPEPTGPGGPFLGPIAIAVAIGYCLALLGLGLFAPGLAIALAVVSFPVAARVGVSAIRRRALSQSTGLREVIWLAIGSLGLFITSAVAGVITFVAVCIPVGLVELSVTNQPTMLAALSVGGLAGLGVAGLLARLLWQMPDRLAAHGRESAGDAVDAQIVDERPGPSPPPLP